VEMAAWYNIGMGVEIKAYPKDGKGQREVLLLKR